MSNDPIVKNVVISESIDGTVIVTADGREVYRGEDAVIVNAWRLIALEGISFEALLVRAMREPPLLQCIDCKNTESCAGAMARQFNHGRCLHCGGYFKVVRA